MPTSYTIVPIPRWYFADSVGRPLGGGYMFTYRSSNKTILKPIYTNSSGTQAYPNPVFFSENGELPGATGALFWADDEAYYIRVYDAQHNFIYDMDNYGPGAAGGGGGGTTVVNNFLENYIVNNDYTSHGGTSVNANGNDTFLNIQNGTVISPSNHHGLVKAATAFTTIPYSGPDVMFVRSNDSSTDNLVFSTVDFILGDNPFAGSDVTPEFYIDLECTSTGSETLKAVQYPLALHVKNFEQTTVSFLFWAKGFSGTQNLTANLIQYFGTGSATTPVVTPITINASPLTNTWQVYNATFTIPSVGGKVLGLGGDDAVYLQICYPVGATFKIFHTKPKFYLANVTTVFPELQTFDYADRIINSPRTGDLRLGFNNYTPYGWTAMNDTTIGTVASLATGRANIDTWPLYALLYVNVSNTYAPVTGGRTAPGNTVAAAYTDYTLNKPLALTKTLGRTLASIGLPSTGGQGITWALGQTTGEELHSLTSAENGPHSHSINYAEQSGAGGSGTTTLVQPGSTPTDSSGSGTGHNTIQPTTYMNVFIKL